MTQVKVNLMLMSRFSFSKNAFLLCSFLVFLYIQAGFPQDRVIRPGDSLEIIVYDHQELSRVVTVTSQGSIDFPFLQNIPVDGLTIEKFRELLMVQLGRYLDTRPIVTVNFIDKEQLTVIVNGQVNKPGVLEVPVGIRLQSAIGTAGGFVPGANLKDVSLIRNVDGNLRQYTFDIAKFLSEGDMKQNPFLADGDEIVVTGNPVYTEVKVLGAVRLPGSFPYFEGATILDMIFQAGGLVKNADVKNVHYISAALKKSVELSLDIEKFYQSPEIYQSIKVKPGDIIIIEEKSKSLWSSFIRTVADFAVIATAVYYITRIDTN